MDRSELIERAAPRCQKCTQPIQRVEYTYQIDPGKPWLMRAWMVCAAGHRAAVEAFDDGAD